MPMHECYEPGEPCWVDYAATDPGGARAFYGALFGWTFEREGAYELIRLGGEVVGGFGRVPPGLPGAWNTYLATGDAGALAGRVGELGGTVVFGPIDAGADGRLLFAVDPAGASVGFWQGRHADGIVLVDEPGTWCRHELWAAGDLAETFYGKLFGARPWAGPWAVPGPRPGLAPRWVTFFRVADAPAARAAAQRLGATAVVRHGAATIMCDPWGALFALTAE